MIDFAKLQKPFAKQEVKKKKVEWTDKKTKQQKSFTADFITSRQVMNRLDEVCGPANWRDFYEVTNAGIVCTIYILCDGEWVGKTDIGVNSDIAPEKGAFADAFKRAAVKWGIGRELYDDGVADLDGTGGEVVQAPQSELEAVFWTRNEARANKLLKFAYDIWKADDPNMTKPHTVNRAAKALGLPNCNGKKELFYVALAENYEGSEDDAYSAVQEYEYEAETAAE